MTSQEDGPTDLVDCGRRSEVIKLLLEIRHESCLIFIMKSLRLIPNVLILLPV